MSARKHGRPAPVVSAAPPTANKLARAVTECLAPTPVVVALFLAVTWHGAASPAEAARWSALTMAFTILPFLYILRGVRRRRLADHHLTRREQRPLPLLLGLVSAVILLTLLVMGGAPRELLALAGSIVAGLVVGLLVTLRWKVSGHAMVAASTVVVLTCLFGPRMLILSPLVALVAWARVQLGDHTPAQVAIGGVAGALSTTVSFTSLMAYLP